MDDSNNRNNKAIDILLLVFGIGATIAAFMGKDILGSIIDLGFGMFLLVVFFKRRNLNETK